MCPLLVVRGVYVYTSLVCQDQQWKPRGKNPRGKHSVATPPRVFHSDFCHLGFPVDPSTLVMYKLWDSFQCEHEVQGDPFAW